MWKFISNEPNENESQSEATEICDEKIQKKKITITKKSPRQNLQRKRQKISDDYRDISFDDFRLMNLDPPQNWIVRNQMFFLVLLVYQVNTNKMKLYPRWY